jgi:hypothetical protein
MIYENWAKIPVSAMPIVDPADATTILGSISASDLRGIKEDNVSTLLLPVLDYLRARSPTRHVRAAVTCVPSDSLDKLLGSLVEHKVHRAWVVETPEREKVEGESKQGGKEVLGDVPGGAGTGKKLKSAEAKVVSVVSATNIVQALDALRYS